MRGRAVLKSVAVVGVAVTLASCGSSSSGGGGTKANAANSTPAAELASAIHSLSDAHSLNLQLSLGASGADLLQIASGLGGDNPTKAQADAIGHDHIGIQIQAAPGKTIGDPAGGKGAFALTLGDADQDYFTLESVDEALYGHIDLRYFLGLINGAPSFSSLEHQVAGAGAPGFIRDALDGKWISLPASTLKSLTGLAAQSQSGASPSAGTLAQLRSKALSTLLADVTVTRSTTGDTDDLKVSFELRKLLTDEYAAVAPLINGFVPGGEAIPALKPGDIPDVTVNFDAFVTNGALSKIVLDAGQFDTKEHISVPIDLNISESGPTISAPADATPIDLSSLGQLFAGA